VNVVITSFKLMQIFKRMSIIDVRSQGEEVVQFGHFSDKRGRGRGLQMWTSAFFDAKKQIFRNLWCVRTDKEG